MNVCKIRNQSADVGEVCATRYCVCKIEEVCVAKKTGEIVITLKERSPAFVQKSKVVVCKNLQHTAHAIKRQKGINRPRCFFF